MLQSQPGILAPEELHFALPHTLALCNASGLHIFEYWHSIEPESRDKTTVFRAIRESALKSFIPTDGLMLIEDIQLGICAMHSKIWQLRERIRDAPSQEK